MIVHDLPSLAAHQCAQLHITHLIRERKRHEEGREHERQMIPQTPTLHAMAGGYQMGGVVVRVAAERRGCRTSGAVRRKICRLTVPGLDGPLFCSPVCSAVAR